MSSGVRISYPPELIIKMKKWQILTLDILLIAGLALFSYIASYIGPALKASLQPDVGLAPTTMWIIRLPWIVHLPLVLMGILTVINATGRMLKPECWIVIVTTIFLIFTLIASVWAMGASCPFWRISSCESLN